jgi:hypothetical protein
MSEVMLREHGATGRNELDGISGNGVDSLVGAVPCEIVRDEDERYERDIDIRRKQAASSIE